MNMPARLKSRKLWMTIAALAAQALLAYSGEIEWDLAIKTIITTVIAYLGAQGYEDGK